MAKKVTKKKALEMIDEAMKAPRKDHKVRVTTLIDGDVLDSLKAEAKDNGFPYQTWLNTLLRRHLMENSGEIAELKKRMDALEKTIGSKSKKSA